MSFVCHPLCYKEVLLFYCWHFHFYDFAFILWAIWYYCCSFSPRLIVNWFNSLIVLSAADGVCNLSLFRSVQSDHILDQVCYVQIITGWVWVGSGQVSFLKLNSSTLYLDRFSMDTFWVGSNIVPRRTVIGATQREVVL